MRYFSLLLLLLSKSAFAICGNVASEIHDFARIQGSNAIISFTAITNELNTRLPQSGQVNLSQYFSGDLNIKGQSMVGTSQIYSSDHVDNGQDFSGISRQFATMELTSRGHLILHLDGAASRLQVSRLECQKDSFGYYLQGFVESWNRSALVSVTIRSGTK